MSMAQPLAEEGTIPDSAMKNPTRTAQHTTTISASFVMISSRFERSRLRISRRVA